MESIEIEKLKVLYPDEWILLGNPVKDNEDLHYLSGIPINHSKNKKDIYYTERDKLVGYKNIGIVYTGVFKPIRKMTGIFRRVKDEI